MHADEQTNKQSRTNKQRTERDKKKKRKSPMDTNGWGYKRNTQASTKQSSLTILLVQADQLLLGHFGGFAEINLSILALADGRLHGLAGFFTLLGVDIMCVLSRR